MTYGIRKYMANELVEKGWLPVKSTSTGALVKNGFMFSLLNTGVEISQYKRNELTSVFQDTKVFHNLGKYTPIMGKTPLQGNSKGFAWTIEKDGWIVGFQSVKEFDPVRVIVDVLANGEIPNKHLKSAVEKIIDKIDQISNYSDSKIKSVKFREINTTTDIEVIRTRDIVANNSFSGYFVCTADDLEPLVMNRVYRFTKSGSVYLISMLTSDLSDYVYRDSPMSDSVFNFLMSQHGIKPIELYFDTVRTTRQVMLDSVDNSELVVPKFLTNLKLPMRQFNIIMREFADNNNYTPLLYNGIELETLDLTSELIKTNTDPRTIMNKKFNKQQLSVMISLAKAGYSLNTIADPEYSAEYMDIKHNEEMGALYELEKDLIAKGRTTTQARAISKIAYKGNGINHVNRDLGAGTIAFIDYCYSIDLADFAEVVLPIVFDAEVAVSIYNNNLSSFAEELFWNRIKMFMPDKFGSNPSDSFLQLVKTNTLMIKYSVVNNVIYVTSGPVELKLSYNYLRIITAANKDWSAVIINGKVISNEINADYITSLF